STFTVYSSSDSVNSLFEIDYFIDFEEEHWVLKQADSVSQKATDLQINTTSQVISEIITMFEEGINYTYGDIADSKKYNVAISIFYTRSVLLAAQREDCACLPVPLFITSKSVFHCQEDIFYEVDNLIATIDTIVAQGTPLDSATTNLYAFLESTQETTIRYDDYNSFYISKVDFQGMITDIRNQTYADDCNREKYRNGKCGSDIGCCGNYAGCCWFWDWDCFVHDMKCLDCKPWWYCLPGCKPEKPSNPSSSIDYK
ncbi:MAG: hypothetical protein JJT94_12480, partial [Bernardetiaceae bacterium]|nr:hypothetical protein [Bernardetiaceae bacterium]